MNRKEVETAAHGVGLVRRDDSYAERGDLAIYAAKHYETVDENIDLYGLSAANAAAALSGGFVVNGSPTQTAMMEDAGGRARWRRWRRRWWWAWCCCF
jgi:hypothetical protein